MKSPVQEVLTHSDSRSPDYVVIDIPEPDLTPIPTDTQLTPPEPVVSRVVPETGTKTASGATESVELRGSGRER